MYPRGHQSCPRGQSCEAICGVKGLSAAELRLKNNACDSGSALLLNQEMYECGMGSASEKTRM